jgi:hypothetical protein
MAGPDDAPELLDVQVQQIAGPLMFVTFDRLPRLQIAHAAELAAAQNTADRGAAQAGLLTDPQPGPVLTAQLFD